MKPAPFLIAAALVAALVLTPMAAAAGSITFSSPASGASYKGSASYTIAGTVSPAPGQADSVFISVKNPAGSTVDATSATVTPSSGAFSYSTAVGGSASWITGTYTITATDSYGATGSTTFTYSAGPPPQAGLALVITAAAGSPVYAGQTTQISALVTWNNGSAASGATFQAWLVSPSGSAAPLTAAPTTPVSGVYWWSYPVPASSANGLYAVVLGASSGGFKAWTQTSFTVNSQIANGASIAAWAATMQKDLGGNFSSLNSAVGTINTAVGGITTTLGNVQTQIGTINTNVGSLSGLSTKLTDAANSIGTTQTYVLVVAVLAAITLVLELAILVRKLS
jgi:hypothetical protein